MTAYRDEQAARERRNGVSQGETSDGYATAYYDLPEGVKDLGDLIEHKEMSFNVGNIFKACYRLGDKAGTSRRYDLNKIIYFAQRELKRHAD